MGKDKDKGGLPTSGPGIVHETSAHNVPEGGANYEYGSIEGKVGTHALTDEADESGDDSGEKETKGRGRSRS